MKNFSGLVTKGELDIIRDRTVELSPLVSILEDCYAHEIDKANRDKDYTPEQNKTRRAENVNMQTHNCWGRQQGQNLWKLVDSRYMHLRDDMTGTYLELHHVNPLTGKVAKPANTRRSIGRYTQKGCRSAKEIEHWWYQNEIVPNLSDVSLQALWRWDYGRMIVTIYKPLDPQRGSFCIELPLIGNKSQQQTLKFEAMEENDNVLQGLLSQDDEHTIDHKNGNDLK